MERYNPILEKLKIAESKEANQTMDDRLNNWFKSTEEIVAVSQNVQSELQKLNNFKLKEEITKRR